MGDGTKRVYNISAVESIDKRNDNNRKRVLAGNSSRKKTQSGELDEENS